ncbi:MAG: HAMP domain-containing sensor histidine kinase [Patescibacteria group bacterium]
MKNKSIHFKIAFWFSLFLFITTGLIFSSFYIVTSKILFQEVDKELLNHSNNLSQFNNIPGMVTTILGQNGIVKQSSISSDTPYLSYKFLYETALKNNSISYVNQNIGNTPMRFMVQPLVVDGKLSEILLIAHPIEAIQNSLNLLLITLGVIFIVLILPTIFGARLLALKILKPISEIADNMNDISSENLDKRLSNSKTNDVIEKLSITFNNLLDRLGQSFTRERQFIGDIAHELKTPIATLKSGIEVTLSKERQKDEYKKALNDTLIDANKMSILVSNILDLAWIGADKSTTNYKVFNFSDSVLDLIEISTKLGMPKGIEIKSDVEKGLKILGDEGKILRAILNLIENSIKYTVNKKPILISLQKSKTKAVLIIKDKGVGISKEEIDHIFNRFYRGSKTAKTVGSGLGLAISLGIIKAHGGNIEIKSNVAVGTVAKIILPIWKNRN